MNEQEQFKEFSDLLAGLLMESYREAENTKPTNAACAGAMMKNQLRRGQALLERIRKYYQNPAKPEPHVNGTAAKPQPVTERKK